MGLAWCGLGELDPLLSGSSLFCRSPPWLSRWAEAANGTDPDCRLDRACFHPLPETDPNSWIPTPAIPTRKTPAPGPKRFGRVPMMDFLKIQGSLCFRLYLDQSLLCRLLGIAIFLRYLVIVRLATPSPCFFSSSTKSSSLIGFVLSSLSMISCNLMRIVS
jgi:hypothetical protein